MELYFVGQVIAITCLLALSSGENPSVNLTVKGEADLSGDVCPGIVTIVCSGVDLTFLRWRYNDDINLITYLTDSVPSNSDLSGPAFISVELLTVSSNDPIIGNFSSKLTVNVSGLQSEGIASIVCGVSKTFQTIPISVNVIQEVKPVTPSEIVATAVYEYGLLREVMVSWSQQQTFCQEALSSLRYHVTLLGFGDIILNASNCGKECMVTFKNFSNISASDEYTLVLYAINSFGSSEIIENPTTIMLQSQSYFTPTLNSTNCVFIGKCFSNRSQITSNCIVSYSADSTEVNRNSTIVSPLNTQFEVSGLSSDTVYYFEFSVTVNECLIVRNKIMCEKLSGSIFSILTTSFLVFFILIGIIIFLLFCTIASRALKQLEKKRAIIIFIAIGGVLILGSIVFFVLFLIVTLVQEDTCDIGWSETRDTLLITSFVLFVMDLVLGQVSILTFCFFKKSQSCRAIFNSSS